MNPETLLCALRALPDFDCFPLPTTWHEKYKINFPEVINTREFCESEYTIKCALAPKDLPMICIDEPIKDGFTYPIFPPENIKTELISAPYTETNPPKILKGLVVADPNTPINTLTEEERLKIIEERSAQSSEKPAEA